ncbi:hypothetical protein D3C76_1149520 [compost metagenome]
MSQISRIGMVKRFGIAMRWHCSAMSSCAASCIAGIGGMPRSCRRRTRAGRAGQSRAANRNAGVTGLFCLIRRSVLIRASLIRVWVYVGLYSSASALAGNSGSNNCRSTSISNVSAAWPERNSLSTSSNRRADGISRSIGARPRIGRALCFSMPKFSLAAKRTARSIRTGSSW